jgi:S1 RNA binding domain
MRNGAGPDRAPIRELVDAVVEAADPPDEAAARRLLEEMRRARRNSVPVAAPVLATTDAGAFLYLGSGLYGFAAKSELPMWVPRRIRQDYVGKELEGLVAGIECDLGLVHISPRLLALRRARNCLGVSRRISGRVVSLTLEGLTVDIGGAQGFAPRRELDIEWMLDQLADEHFKRGERWRGYVVDIAGGQVPILSQFGSTMRASRQRRREAALAELSPGDDVVGTVVATGSGGALVAFAGGLVTGLVSRRALATPIGWSLVPGTDQTFRVLARVDDPDDEGEDIDLRLWPAP